MAPPKGPRPCSAPLHRALPQQVRFLHGESAGSFVHRLAAANGLEFADLLHLIGRGRKKLPAPGSAELYFNAAALSRLSVLSGRDPRRLQHALPAARPENMLPSVRNYPAWRWFPQESGRQRLVTACRGCAAVRGAMQTVYVWSDLPWQVCLRHGTWQDLQPDRDAWAPPAKAMTWILQTHQRRLAFEQRLGPMGRPLFADAYMTLLTWQQQGWMLPQWLDRRQSLDGIDSTSPLLASVVMYPEAVELAQLFGQYERRRLTGTLQEHQWRWQLADAVVRWQAPPGWPVRTATATDEAREPIDAWIARHNPTGGPRRTLHRVSVSPPHWTQLHRHRRLRLQEPHPHTDPFTPLERMSCLSLASDTAHVTEQVSRTRVSYTSASAGMPAHAAPWPRRPGAARQEVQKSPWQQRNAWPVAGSPARHSGSTVPPRAVNLRWWDPDQLSVIAAAARREGASMQEYILSAAYTRATAAE